MQIERNRNYISEDSSTTTRKANSENVQKDKSKNTWAARRLSLKVINLASAMEE